MGICSIFPICIFGESMPNVSLFSKLGLNLGPVCYKSKTTGHLNKPTKLFTRLIVFVKFSSEKILLSLPLSNKYLFDSGLIP